MKLNHLEVVKDWEGNTIQSEGKDLTYRELIVTAVNNVGPQENMGAEAKARSYAISGKLYGKGKDVVLTVDERSFIKERAGIILSPLAYGRLCDWLEGDNSNPTIVE